MNFDFSDELKALREQARKFLADRCPPSVPRRLLDGTLSFDQELWRAISEMGWVGAAIPEAYGGAGLGALGLCVLAGELGYALAPVPFSSSAYLAAEAILLAGSPAQKERTLPLLAQGTRIGTLALAESEVTRVHAGKLTGVKLPVPDGDCADLAVVTAREGSMLSLHLVELSGAGIRRERVETIDPTRPQARITFTDAPAEPLGRPEEGASL